MSSSVTLRRWRVRATQWFLERVLRAPGEVRALAGGRPGEGVPYVRLEAHELWAAESLRGKALALLRLRWQPSPTLIHTQARYWHERIFFGGEEDYGPHLWAVNDWHLRRDWTLDALTSRDRELARALGEFTTLTRLRYENVLGFPTLRLAQRAPYVSELIYPMVAKTPIIPLKYFLDLHVHYAFNAVRRAKHPHGDDIIGYLYELLFLQQKTALALLEFARLMSHVEAHKGQATLTNAETDAMIAADGLFAHLKASVEKTIALVGITHGISNGDVPCAVEVRVVAAAGHDGYETCS